MGILVESKLKTDLERALDSNIIKWKIIDYKCRDFWIFSEPDSHRLIFIPVQEKMDDLMTCYEAAYKWGYEGVLFSFNEII